MKVLLVGDRGREHALALCLERSPLVAEIHCRTNNAGIQSLSKWRPINEGQEVLEFARYLEPGLVVIGPEQPLADGLVNRLQEYGIPAFGPTQGAAQLETSKSFGKELMDACGVPTAPWKAFSRSGGEIHAHQEAATLFDRFRGVVVKADGLAAGKGVFVCRSKDAYESAIRQCLRDGRFGSAGDRIIIEKLLEGDSRFPRAEFSVFALVDIYGNFILCPAAQDYKPVGDDDEGPNTGGMGSIAPVPWVLAEMMEEVRYRIFKPIIRGMLRRGAPFSGVLYAGLMWTSDGPKVLEFNVRFGDPEFQALSMLLKSDLVRVMKTIADGGSIEFVELSWMQGVSCLVTLASDGYPDSYEKGFGIEGLDSLENLEDITVFHARTRKNADGDVVTDGGRVMGIGARGVTVIDAAISAYRVASYVTFPNKYCRTDIGTGYY